MEDALHEAHGEGGVHAVYVGDVVGVLLVDFVEDEAEGAPDGGVVRAGGGGGSGAEQGVAGARLEELHFLEGGEG